MCPKDVQFLVPESVNVTSKRKAERDLTTEGEKEMYNSRGWRDVF